jgi:hypothetical protein
MQNVVVEDLFIELHGRRWGSQTLIRRKIFLGLVDVFRGHFLSERYEGSTGKRDTSGRA